MVRFIRQEAEEKAAEIAVTAEEVKKREEERREEEDESMPLFSTSSSLALPDLDAFFSPSALSKQEFNIEKLTLLDAEKARVAREFERRDAAVEVKKKM